MYISNVQRHILFSTSFRFSQFDSHFVPLSVIPYESYTWIMELMHPQCHYFSLGNMVHIEWLIFSFLLLDFPQPKTVGYTISWLYKYERNCLITFIFEYNDIIYCVNHICHAWAVMIEMTCIPLREGTQSI